MVARASLNVWRQFGLLQSPFFIEALEPSQTGLYPITLFRGAQRKGEADVLLRKFHSTENSRTLILGPPGVGKTTFINYAKHLAFDAGEHVATAQPVNLEHRMTKELFEAELLRAILVAAERGRPDLKWSRERGWKEAWNLVSDSLRYGMRVGVTTPVGGGDVQRSPLTQAARVFPPGAWLEAIRNSLAAILSQVDGGVVVHINNVDAVGDKDPETVRDLFDDIRDHLKLAGLHFLLAATPEFIDDVLRDRQRVLDILTDKVALGALSVEEFQDVMDARYRAFQETGGRVIPPVPSRDLQQLFDMFDGDLRTLFGLVESTIIRHASAGQPIQLKQILEYNAASLLREAQTSMTDARWKILELLFTNPDREFIQKEVVEGTRLDQPTISTTVKPLITQRWVLARRDGRKVFYRLTGLGRIAVAAFPSS